MTHDAAREAMARVLITKQITDAVARWKRDSRPYPNDAEIVQIIDAGWPEHVPVAGDILAKLAELGFLDASGLTSDEAVEAACIAFEHSGARGFGPSMKAAISAAVAVAKGEK